MGTTQLMEWMAIVMIAGVVGLIIVKERYRPFVAFLIVLVNTVLSSIPSLSALIAGPQLGALNIPHFTGDINLKIDSLSAWFILIINFTSITGILYGSGYLKSYPQLKTNLELHWVFYVLFHLSMVWVCMFDNGIGFLIAWEIMSLTSLMLVIFEFQNKKTLKAGINYMVQMHLSVALLTLGFIMLYVNTGSFNFESLAQISLNNKTIWIFVCLFVGFAIKAGFIPFHTWFTSCASRCTIACLGCHVGGYCQTGYLWYFQDNHVLTTRLVVVWRSDPYLINYYCYLWNRQCSS